MSGEQVWTEERKMALEWAEAHLMPRPPNRGRREALRCDQSERAPPTKSLIQ